MNKKFHFLVLGIYTFSLFNFAGVPATTFAQDACSIANSHQEGTQCICDPGYAAENGACVIFSCNNIANSHQVKLQCICDQFYKPENGACVPMSESEICPLANSHQEGDKCLCNEGYASIGGKCINGPTFCSTVIHHASWSAAINDCKCDEGYIEGTSDCIPDPNAGASQEKPKDTSNEGATGTEQTTPTPPAPGTSTSDTPVPPPLTPGQIILLLNDNSGTKLSADDIIKAGLKAANEADKNLANKQEALVNNMVSPGDGETPLPPDTNQNLNIVAGAEVKAVLNSEQNWYNDLSKAEAEGRVKNESDKQTFDDLKHQEQGLLTQYKNNQDALQNLAKQTFQILTLTKLPTIPNSDMIFKADPNGPPQHDFVKENNGDLKGAMASVTEATAGQMQLLQQIKDQIRQIKEQKQSLLNVPPKPNTDAKLNAIGDKYGWEKNWYK